MRRTQLTSSTKGQRLYRFRCMECTRTNRRWVWPAIEDPSAGTAQRAPLEVRLHVLAHHPDRVWAPIWRTPKPKPNECPSCGFALDSWKIPKELPKEEEDD